MDSAIIGTYVANSLIDMGATTVGSEIRAPSVLRSILTLGIAELYERKAVMYHIPCVVMLMFFKLSLAQIYSMKYSFAQGLASFVF